MQVVYANTRKKKKEFKNFRKKIYNNDPYYVSTVEFTCDMLLYQTTKFALECDIWPIMIMDKEVLCEALLIKAPNDDFLQIAFFEAQEDVYEAVDLLILEAKKLALEKSVTKIIIGLNGHLSYGVGLSVDMKNPNTFDSTYTKLYYNNYFSKYLKHELVSFSTQIDDIINVLPNRENSIKIRKINFKEFPNEMENFRMLCDKTIGKTFLYSKTNSKHFEELIKDMLFFLKEENILFAYKDDLLVGFVFWHPDYNEILKKGKSNSLLNIAFRYITCKKRIKKVKLNSIGVVEEYQGIATISLLKEVSKYITNYDILETNFVWCNNHKSMNLNKHILKKIERKFVVYEVNV